MPSSSLPQTSYGKNYQEIRKIFGKNIAFSCTDDMLKGILFEELSLYPASSEDSDFLVEIVSQKEMKARIRSLSETDYITITTKIGSRCFIFKNRKLSHILFSLNKPVNVVHGWLQRFRNIEFHRREERIGQIIHEHVLVPSVLFQADIVPIHSSAVKYNNQVILFGGHGGVGKTSLELELCFYNEAHFIADDISVGSVSGDVYPNLSYPKIYGYNVQGQPSIKDLVVDNANIMDRLHWSYQLLKGPNKVRRRISPAILYKNYLNQTVPINRYLILKRYEGEQFHTEKLPVEEAAGITVEILKKEFSDVLLQLDQQQNENFKKYKSKSIINRWSNLLPTILKSVSCEIIYIPEKISHQSFKKKMLELFS